VGFFLLLLPGALFWFSMPAVTPHDALYSKKLPDGRLNWQACLHVDLLSSTARALLGSDLLSQFVPTLFDLSCWDRTRALEKAWSDGYKETTGHELDNLWFKDLQAKQVFDQPRLLFMTTNANTGRPVAVSNVSFSSDSSIDTLDTIAPNIDVRLVTAAIMSARFPVITPPARLPVSEGGRPVRLLDGGYFENSGVTCTLALLREIATDTVLNKVRFIIVRIERNNLVWLVTST